MQHEHRQHIRLDPARYRKPDDHIVSIEWFKQAYRLCDDGSGPMVVGKCIEPEVTEEQRALTMRRLSSRVA